VTFNKLGRLSVMAACVGVAAGLAAQNAPAAPVQGYPSPVLATEPIELQVTPDEHPLSGGQVLGIGTWGARHSYVVPSIRVAETLDNNPSLLDPGNGAYRGFTDFGSSLQWRQYIGRDMEFRYSGAFRYDSKARVQGYDQFTNSHGVALSKIARIRNWTLLIDDEAAYSQGSDFGNVGMEGMGTIATLSGDLGNLSNAQLPLNSVRPDLLPDQSILTGRVGRISNIVLAEIDNHLSARDTVTLAASYGLLHFNSSLLTNLNQVSAVTGFNHKMSLRDTIAIEGAFTRFGYSSVSSFVSTEYVTALYSRQVSGKSSFEVGAGPQITQSHFGHPSRNNLNWQARGVVRYRAGRVNLAATGTRGVTAGAGVVNGAIATTGQGSAELAISRYNSMLLAAGISHNQQLEVAQRYNTQFASIVLNREFFRYTSVFLSYDFQHQTTNARCTGPICNLTGSRNVFGIGVAWTHSPIGVQ